MSDKKHIDRLFQEGFKDFEATPSDAVWKNIEANLNKKKKRRVIPIWWRYAGVAALLLLLLTIGGVLFNNSETEPPVQVVETEDVKTIDSENNNLDVSGSNEKETIVDKTQNPEIDSNNLIDPTETSIAGTSGSQNINESQIDEKPNGNYVQKHHDNIITSNESKVASNNKLQKNLKNTNVASVKSEENNTKSILQNDTPNIDSNSNNAIATNKTDLNAEENKSIVQNQKEEESLTIEEALEKNNDVVEETKKTSRWALVPNAAPVYFNSLGQGSSIDPQFNNNAKSGEVNMSYGISASYALNDRVSIRSGIHKVSLGYNTNDVIIYQTAGVSVNSSLRNVNEASNSFVASDNVALASESNFNDAPRAFSSTNTTLNQAFGYIEIPLEIQYALSNKKLGINVIGGFSSFFLNNNKIYSEAQNGNRLFLGEANNLNKVSYSANFGLGFNYHISKKLDLNLEPMFKYQFNTFSNTSGNFAPFFIGVYSGFAIKF